ncbi:MAG: tRNA guanosine(34) transglycosylase Tgt, partial [Patescibacteria group bacterium]
MQKFGFSIVKQLGNGLGRAGVINTPNGKVETPAFIAVGTAASVKSLSPEQVREAGAQAVLSNTYHLYLRPGSEIVKKAGGLSKFMNWNGPTFTDSGGFQVFSLGAAFGKGISKFKKHVRSAELSVLVADAKEEYIRSAELSTSVADASSEHAALVSIDEDGVTFRSHIDGTEHRLTPEKSMEIQHDLGADIIFAFDECTSPDESKEYQREAMDRTHRWAARSLARHKELGGEQALMGIVQGGRYQD